MSLQRVARGIPNLTLQHSMLWSSPDSPSRQGWGWTDGEFWSVAGNYRYIKFYIPVTARCTKANTAITRNRMIAAMLHPRPALAATPNMPPVPAKNKTT